MSATQENTLSPEVVAYAEEIMAGLQSKPKKLFPKHLYDERGDKIFQQIMQLEEYYQMRTEIQILANHKEWLLETMLAGVDTCRLVELGAGDGLKTKVLLRYFWAKKAEVTYVPVDISGHIVGVLTDDLRDELPGLKVEGIAADYFDALRQLPRHATVRSAVFFLGTTIGNMEAEECSAFLQNLSDALNPGDLVLIGADVKKSPRQILASYDDSQGVTQEFARNQLVRINRELDADFDPEAFVLYPTYDPVAGECRFHLMSTVDQTATLGVLGRTVDFYAWEPIYLGRARKFDAAMLEAMANEHGFKLVKHLTDENNWYIDTVWEKI